MIKAEIKNCNNIDKCSFVLKKNHLNIRYAMNGTGKSTIANAIVHSARNEELSQLEPYASDLKPSCSLSPTVEKVILFNEDYVNTVVLQESNLIQNAFEVFIRTPAYEEKLKSINQRLGNFRINIQENKDVKTIADKGTSVLSKLTKTQSGQFTVVNQRNGTLFESETLDYWMAASSLSP
jgi:hypothetical protein